MNITVTLQQIAEALNITKRSAERRSIKESWLYVEQPGRGGRKRLYAIAALPKDVRGALSKAALFAVEQSLPAVAAIRPVSNVVPIKAARLAVARDAADARQMIVRDARLGILNAIERVVQARGMTHSQAINVWLSGLKEGSMASMQQLWCALANNKNGYEWDLDWSSGHASAVPRLGQSLAYFAAKLSRNTLYRWIGMRREGGDDALIPRKVMKDMRMPAWAPYLLAEMQRPQKPSLSRAYRLMEKNLLSLGWCAHVGNSRCGEREYPSYDAVSRWYDQKYSKLDRQRGRNTGSAMNPHKFAHKRTSDDMWPLLEVHSDGWNTHFTAPHPVSGKFVTFEVWHSHDVATRKAYVDERSIGLSESMIVILGSLYAVCAQDGEPVVWQTDNTGSVKNDRVEFDPAASIASRRGMTIVHNLPGNSQANGIAENFNKYLDECAKELATYQGKGMDSLTAKRVLRITQKMVKAQNIGDLAEAKKLRVEAQRVGCGVVFGSFQEAVDWVKRVVAEFNDRPHSELPKITDPFTGKRRHMTPNEMMAQFIADGWPHQPLAGDDLADAFRVHERKTVRRGKVSVMGQEYHHADLDHINGEQVLVAYDIQDGSRVWVKTLEGALICEAPFYAARGYRERSFYEIALDKRADAQQKRLQKKYDDIEAQRPSALIDFQPAIELPVMDFARIEEVREEVPAVIASNVVDLPVPRPTFGTDASKFRWLMQNTDQITDLDEAWINYYRMTPEWEDIFGDREVAAR